MHNHTHKPNSIISKLAVIVLSIVLLTGISLVPAIQIVVQGQVQQQQLSPLLLPPPTSDILTYQNSSYGITIQYPANWTIDEVDFDPNDPYINIVAFSSPLESRCSSITLLIEESTISAISIFFYLHP